MATATNKSRATRQAQRCAAVVAESAAITFLVFEDNGGSYHWTLLGPDGDSLAYSRRFATHEEAAHAALVVRDGAASARCEPGGAPDLPVDLVARRNAAVVRDDSDAERWLDEGGRFTSQGVTQ
jgi:uncharacterized protein YegP (UPF0339 family)